MNGHAITGGFELALACDLLIASENAQFGDTHARVGIVPGWGLSQKLPRLIGIGRAKELSLTGNFIGAEQAGALGAREPRGARARAARRRAASSRSDMLSCDPPSLRRYKQMIDRGYAGTFADGTGARAEDLARAPRRRDVRRRSRRGAGHPGPRAHSSSIAQRASERAIRR